MPSWGVYTILSGTMEHSLDPRCRQKLPATYQLSLYTHPKASDPHSYSYYPISVLVLAGWFQGLSRYSSSREGCVLYMPTYVNALYSWIVSAAARLAVSYLYTYQNKSFFRECTIRHRQAGRHLVYSTINAYSANGANFVFRAH